MSASVGRRRAVVLVGNPAAPYSRALKIGRVLDEAGFDVEIAAVAAPGVAEREVDGAVEYRRYRPSGPLAIFAASHAGVGTAAAARPVPKRDEGSRRVPRLTAVLLRPIRRARAWLVRRGGELVRWGLWPHTVRGWWATVDRELEEADLYHACGSLAIAPALRARDRARAKDRPAVAIYDAIDNVFESNNVVSMPRLFRRWHGRRERAWALAADARLTVNDDLADRLATRWGTDRPVVVPNYPDVPSPAAGDRSDLIRAEVGLPPSKRIVLFQGRLGPNLGLDEAAEAVLRVPDSALVLIGFGRWLDRCRARDADPRFEGRHFTLGARHPDELTGWTASADVVLVTLPPVSLNQRHSSPNKFWEAIGAGTPLVVGPDLPFMNRLIEAEDLGVVAPSLAPDELAAAIAAVLERVSREGPAWRSRIAATARERYSWPVAAGRYREVLDRLRS